MKKNQLLLLFLLIFLLAGCSSRSGVKQSESERVLTVTIEPQRYFLEQIVGDKFKVNSMLPSGSSPESYEPPPSLFLDIARSQLYLRVGNLGFEKAWSNRLVENNPEMPIVNCSEGIEPIEGSKHFYHSTHHHHADEAMDPHLWTSPRVVKLLTANMLKAVVEIDSDNEQFYRDNFEKFMIKVDSIDNIIKELLSDLTVRSFIIFHPALGYFASEYGLIQYSIEFEGKNPSPAQIRGLIDIARKEKINTLFVQRGFDIRNGKVIAAEIGAELFEIDPLSYDWDRELIKIASILGRESN